MTKSIKVVGAAIIREGKILCAQRSPHMTLPNFWEFPGGKIEEKEEPEAALIRELKEEMNADIKIIDRINTTTYDYDFGTVELTVYTAELLSKEITLLEHSDAKWLSPKELKSLEWAPVDIPAVKKISTLVLK